MADNINVTIEEAGEINVSIVEDGSITVTMDSGVKEVPKKDTFTGDGVEKSFTLTYTARLYSDIVFLQGIFQHNGDDYTLNTARTIITFGTAPKDGRKIDVVYLQN